MKKHIPNGTTDRKQIRLTKRHWLLAFKTQYLNFALNIQDSHSYEKDKYNLII